MSRTFEKRLSTREIGRAGERGEVCRKKTHSWPLLVKVNRSGDNYERAKTTNGFSNVRLVFARYTRLLSHSAVCIRVLLTRLPENLANIDFSNTVNETRDREARFARICDDLLACGTVRIRIRVGSHAPYILFQESST